MKKALQAGGYSNKGYIRGCTVALRWWGNPEGEVGVGVNGMCDDDGPGRFNGTGAQHGSGTGIIILYPSDKMLAFVAAKIALF